MRPTYQLSDLPTLDHVIDRSPLTVASDTPVVDAIALLSQAQADCVLVVEESQLVGVFIEQDVVRLTASGMDLSRLKLFEVITRQVITLTQSNSQDLFTAFSLMRQHRIRHLPIVDKRNHLVGLVTQTSLLQVFDPKAMYGVIEALQQQVAAQTTELKQAGQLQQEVASRQQIALYQGQAELEIRVAERNSELVKVNQELQTTLEELQVNEEELGSTNEELATARETAELEHQRYQDLFESAPDGYLLTDTCGIIQEATSVAAALLSVHQEYLVGKPLIVFIAKQDHKTFRTRLTNLQVVEDWELYIQPQRNKPLSASISVAPAHDLQGQVVGMRWLIRDISDRKQAEESLRGNQRLTQRIIETMPEILYIYDLVEQCNTFISSQITEILGYTSQEVQAMGETVLPNLVHPDDLARVTEHLKRFETLQEGEVIEIEYRMRHANREWHWLHSRETVFTKNAAGLPVQILGAAQDITERKLAELTLQESESKFRAVFNSALDAIAIADDDGRYIDANSSACELFGVSKEELLGSSIADFAEPELDFTQAWQTFREQGQLSGEFRLYRPDGIVREVEYAARTDFLPHRHLSILRDISDRKQVEDKLRSSEEQLRLALDFSHIGSWGWDLNTGKMTWNENFDRLLGLVPGEVEASYQTWRDRVHPEDIEGVEQALNHALATHTYYEAEYRIIHPDGSIHYLAARGQGLYNESGQGIRMAGVVFDITERKQAEAELRESEQRYMTLTQAVPVGIFRTDPEGHCLYVNERWCRITGLSLQEARQDGWTQALHPDDQERIFSEWYQCAQQNLPFQSEYRFQRSDGTTWVFGQAIAERGIDDQLIGYVGTITDISDRKQAEEVLRQYERTVSATPDGVALVDRNYTYRLVNQTYLLRHNRCHDEIIGRPISKLLGEDVFTDTIKPLLDQSLAGETIRYEAWFNYPIADHRFISVTYAPYIEMDGTISGVVVNTRDLSELKQAEEKIREQAALLDIATDAIFVRNLDNQILFWSKGAEHLYGWSSEEALGKNAKALLNKEITPQLEEALKTVAESGSWQGELHKVDKFGKEIIVASRLTLVRDEQGQPKSILTVDTDITEKKKLEAQFLRAQRMESIGTLAGGIAHDLNNVLAPILMAVQLLQMKSSDQQSDRLLKTVENNVKRGAALIKQVLSFARGIEGDRTIVQVRHLILEIDHIVKETFPKSIEFYTDIASDLWTVSADATQLDQVLMNFCVNARDAMPNGGTLTISATNVLIDESYTRMNIEAKVGPHVVITVADTGTGIPPKVIERIFDPFFTTKEIGKGTGLGLSTALGIIKSHGGFVEVSSKVGQGTQFKVYLPTSEETATQLGEDPEVLTGQGGLVLVVDDEAAIREITLTTLESYNYKVLTANDGIEALALYAQHTDEINVVLIDMMMPEMDGLTAIRALQRMNTSVKIIATSGLASSDKVNLAVGTGAKAFLFKPYTAPELLRTLHEVLSAK